MKKGWAGIKKSSLNGPWKAVNLYEDKKAERQKRGAKDQRGPFFI